MALPTAHTTVTSRRVSVDGVELQLHSAGEQHRGTPLVLLHGGGLDSALVSYGAVLPMLGADRPVYAPDLPGFGASGRPDAPYTLQWYIDILEGLADTLNLKQFDLGGLSLGGGIALGYALQHPSHVHRLVLIAPYGLTNRIPSARLSAWLIRRPGLYAKLNRWAVANRWVTRLTLKQLVVSGTAITNDVVSGVMAAARDDEGGRAWNKFQQSELDGLRLRTNYVKKLQDLDMPVLLMSGKQDRLVPAADVRAAARKIRRGRVVELDACGHWLPRDQATRFVSEVSVFLGLNSAVM